MRSLYIVLASVAVCSVAVLAKSPFRPDDGSGSEYTPAPVTSADPYATPAPVAQDASAPYAEETPALVIEETSYSAATVDVYETPAPVADEGSGSEYTSAPTASVVECETHAPVADDGSGSEYTSALTPSVDAYRTPAPVARDASAPIVEETPAPEEASGEEQSSYRRAHRRHRQVDNTTADSPTTTKTRPSSTTTARPSMTTTARPGSNATEESGNATATCAASAVCFHDDECGSTGDKKGSCIGVFNGKCNCNACINFLSCKDDSACGGLKGACNTTTSRCSCEEGFKANGFASFLDTLREFCNVKDCNADNSDKQCFGLPCHSGRCVC